VLRVTERDEYHGAVDIGRLPLAKLSDMAILRTLSSSTDQAGSRWTIVRVVCAREETSESSQPSGEMIFRAFAVTTGIPAPMVRIVEAECHSHSTHTHDVPS
jgi:hypothetical protein